MSGPPGDLLAGVWALPGDGPEAVDEPAGAVADLRRASARYPDEPRLTGLIRRA